MSVMEELGTVKNHGFDADGYERCERLEAIVDCSVCGKEVGLWSDTEEWIVRGGKNVHSSFGCAQGVCCGRLYIDSFDGCFEYKLEHTQ